MRTFIAFLGIGAIAIAAMTLIYGVLSGIEKALSVFPDWVWILITIAIAIFFFSKDEASDKNNRNQNGA